MMTQTSSHSRIIVVWSVLFAFFCCMAIPATALAKKEITIATEGDPTDGLDYSGGGGSGNLDGDIDGEPPIDPVLIGNHLSLDYWYLRVFFVPIWENGKLTFSIAINVPNDIQWGKAK